MGSYLDYMSYGTGGLNSPRNIYEHQLNQYQQQLSQYQQGNSYGAAPQYQQAQPQQQMQVPVQQMQIPIQQIPMQQVAPQVNAQAKNDDLYLQSLFMEFLRSSEMQDFTNTFYSKFSIFYKNKTGLEYTGPGFSPNLAQMNLTQQNTNIPPMINQPTQPPMQPTQTQMQPTQVQEAVGQQKYVIEQ